MIKLIRTFRKNLAEGRSVVGPFMKTTDPAFVECSGHSGFDFAILDMEHGPVSLDQMQNLVRGAQCSNMLPIVRTPDASEIAIGQALDIGAAGVQVPQISTAAQARAVVHAAKFHPQGERGMCRFVRAAHYSTTERNDYFEQANEALVIIHLEGNDALENLDEILAVDGIDIVFIGPYDLSQSLGLPGQITHPTVVAKMRKVVEQAKKKNRTVGTFTDTPDQARSWKEAGVQYIAYSVDVGIYADACQALLDSI